MEYSGGKLISADIYISFKLTLGAWGTSKVMGAYPNLGLGPVLESRQSHRKRTAVKPRGGLNADKLIYRVYPRVI